MTSTLKTFRVKASRGRESESVFLFLEGEGGSANLWIDREQAYALAQQLQHEADWLASPIPPLKHLPENE